MKDALLVLVATRSKNIVGAKNPLFNLYQLIREPVASIFNIDIRLYILGAVNKYVNFGCLHLKLFNEPSEL